MIIVSGSLYVEPADRDSYLAGCRDVIVAARAAEGCVDFGGSGPSQEQHAAIRDARVVQHEVASSKPL